MTLTASLDFIEQHGFAVSTAILLLASLIQISPLRINPWSWAVNSARETLGINDMLSEMMDARRARIIQFDNELVDRRTHRKDMFDAIMIDCDKYERYCNSHKGYVNSIAGDAIRHIRETYHELKKNGGFTTAEGGDTNAA